MLETTFGECLWGLYPNSICSGLQIRNINAGMNRSTLNVQMDELVEGEFSGRKKKSEIVKKPFVYPKGRPQGGNFLI